MVNTSDHGMEEVPCRPRVNCFRLPMILVWVKALHSFNNSKVVKAFWYQMQLHKKGEFGLAWQKLYHPKNKTLTIYHHGLGGGFRSGIYINPITKLIVFSMINSSLPTSMLAQDIFNILSLSIWFFVQKFKYFFNSIIEEYNLFNNDLC